MDSLFFDDREAWRAWLAANHATCRGIWLVFYKKHTRKSTLSYDAAVEEALCFGWIDGVIRRLDEERCARKFTPRLAAGSRWSAANLERARRMIRENRMTEAGFARYRGVEAHVPPSARSGQKLPDHLARRLARHPRASQNFERLPPSEKRLYVGWIVSAKKEETRLRRLGEAILRLDKGLKLGMK